MKVTEILESVEDFKTIPSVRMLKFSVKDGSNDLDLNLKDAKCHYYMYSWAPNGRPFYFIGKPNACKVGDKIKLPKSDKLTIDAASNSKLGDAREVFSVMKTFDEFMAEYRKQYKELGSLKIVVDAKVVESAPKTDAKPKVEVDEDNPENGYFILGYWINAYRVRDREYFFGGPFRERDSAKSVGDRAQKRGQPKTFRDWMAGSNKIIRGVDKFKIEAEKVGLNPNLSDLYFKD